MLENNSNKGHKALTRNTWHCNTTIESLDQSMASSRTYRGTMGWTITLGLLHWCPLLVSALMQCDTHVTCVMVTCDLPPVLSTSLIPPIIIRKIPGLALHAFPTLESRKSSQSTGAFESPTWDFMSKVHLLSESKRYFESSPNAFRGLLWL